MLSSRSFHASPPFTDGIVIERYLRGTRGPAERKLHFLGVGVGKYIICTGNIQENFKGSRVVHDGDVERVMKSALLGR